jgi:hypothetical protein
VFDGGGAEPLRAASELVNVCRAPAKLLPALSAMPAAQLAARPLARCSRCSLAQQTHDESADDTGALRPTGRSPARRTLIVLRVPSPCRSASGSPQPLLDGTANDDESTDDTGAPRSWSDPPRHRWPSRRPVASREQREVPPPASGRLAERRHPERAAVRRAALAYSRDNSTGRSARRCCGCQRSASRQILLGKGLGEAMKGCAAAHGRDLTDRAILPSRGSCQEAHLEPRSITSSATRP